MCSYVLPFNCNLCITNFAEIKTTGLIRHVLLVENIAVSLISEVALKKTESHFCEE
jgi:hypothetical protein